METMQKTVLSLLIYLISVLLCISVSAQENGNNSGKILKNNVNVYVSLFEYNINYERNIMQRRNSYTNLRAGFGLAAFNSWEGYYYNAALVHLIGKKNSHFELNLGLKYVLEEGTANSLMPDLFAGYRYEKPSGGLILRAGIDLFTLWNIGIGFKF
jgi:hypothetical protein